MLEALLQQLSNSSRERGDREFEAVAKESEPPLLSEVPPEMMKPIVPEPDVLDKKSKAEIIVPPKLKKSILKEKSSFRPPRQGTKSALGLNNINYMNLIEEAIANVKDRNGVTLQRIKTYLTNKYGLNMVHSSIYINNNLKKGMEKGIFKNGRSKQRYKLTNGASRTISSVRTSSSVRNASTVRTGSTVRAGRMVKPTPRTTSSKKKEPKVLQVLKLLNRRGRVIKKKHLINKGRMTNVSKGMARGISNKMSGRVSSRVANRM